MTSLKKQKNIIYSEKINKNKVFFSKKLQNTFFILEKIKGGNISNQMSMLIEVEKNEFDSARRKVTSTDDVLNLKEVKEIRNAIQEHFFIICLDHRNNIKKIELLGIGNENQILINVKYLIRTALISASNKVILIHNHPADSTKPSKHDIELTNTVNKMLDIFKIKLLDHIIVTENEFSSMYSMKLINDEYKSENIKLLDKVKLEEEIYTLKEKNKELNSKLLNYMKKEKEDSEEYE